MKTEDMATYQREWEAKNKEKRKEINRRAKTKLKAWFNAYKATLRCTRCTEDDPSCLDFHHVDDNKEHGVAKLISVGGSKARILAEVQKCIVLCSNCHRKEHARLRTFSG